MNPSSQLGFMFVGIAVGGPAVGIFHLVAHAAGKATMFLAAGIFQHARGTTSLKGLAGAGRADRTTFAAFAIGAASIAAVPPLAAFWSKDAILLAAEENPAWLVLSLLAAAGSAAYLLRPALVLWRRPASAGEAARASVESHTAAAAARPRRAGRPAMLAGAGTLAAASLVLGFAGAPLADLIGGPAPGSSPLSVGLSLGALLAGVVAVLAAPSLPSLPPRIVALARAQLGATAALRALAERPLLLAARAADALDRTRLDAVVDGTARGGLALAALSDRIERSGIDAAVDGTARAIGRGGDRSSRLQSGRLHEYLRDTVLGAAAVAFILVLTAVL
jgi:NADH-quinone oxidoreductase subunit L